jgi:hypothetical protein
VVDVMSPEELAGLYAELGRELAGHGGADEAFAALARAAVTRIPGTDWASVTEGRRGRFRTVGATDDAARAADAIQYELSSGPCVDAARQEAVHRVPELAGDGRWPEFARRATARVGVRSMLSFRLFVEADEVVAALNLYATRPAAFGPYAEIAGTVLAAHGARAVTAAAGREHAGHLETALVNRREIGVAMGVLMTRHKISRDEAFTLLRISSQHENRKLAAIATEVADTGVLRLPSMARN